MAAGARPARRTGTGRHVAGATADQDTGEAMPRSRSSSGPSAAAAAAMELQDAITHEQWGLREPMRIRIALHTGESSSDGDIFGRRSTAAARLRSARGR